jgi:hypothetical protein
MIIARAPVRARRNAARSASAPAAAIEVRLTGAGEGEAMADVFISYSRADQDVVRLLAEAVKRLGHSVWWDDELPPHRSYSEVISDMLGEARAAIVVWSRGSIGSEWVRAEADLARNQKKLIQTSIDDCMPPMPFNQIQFASLAGWQGEDGHPGWTKVKGSLAALVGETSDLRPVYKLPDGPPPGTEVTRPVTAPAPTRRRSNILPGALIGGSLVVIAGVGLLALTRGGNTSAPVVNQAAAAPPAGNVVQPGVPRTEAPASAAPAQASTAGPSQTAPPAPTRTPRQTTRQPQRQQAAMPQRPRYRMGAARMPLRRARRAY